MFCCFTWSPLHFFIFHLSRLLTRKVTGPDGILSKLFRITAHYIRVPLANIFNLSLSCSFPSLSKCGHVSPIPNHLLLLSFSTYLTLVSNFKSFENIVLTRVKPDSVSCFGQNQYAYRPFGSTSTTSKEIWEYVTVALESRNIMSVNVFCLDLSWAFDK